MFGNKEPKEPKAAKETKEEKKARKTQELLTKYGVQNLSDPQDIESVKTIANELMGNSMIETGAALCGKSEDVAKLTYMRAIVEQNFMIIRSLDKLSQSLRVVRN